MYYDFEFLRRLDANRTKITYAKIIALTIDESPLETIEGRITQGSISLDGDSAVRRTCSLTMIAQDYDYNNYLWGLNTKFKLEIGLENTIDPTYPDIIWFKQGTYYISSFNTSRSTNNFTITIQGKDKMCGLNGEVGGIITSSTDFGTIEEVSSDGIIKIVHLPLKDIICNIVHLYGGEPLHNIIINDLDMSGLELLEYRYDEDTPLYFYREEGKDKFDNVLLGNTVSCSTTEEGPLDTTLDELTNQYFLKLLNPLIGVKENVKPVWMDDGSDKKKIYLAKVLFGDTAGYRLTDLTYPGDLIGNVGESLTVILDKIKNILGDFEYFYNLDGQFVFQKKKIYVNTSFSPVEDDSEGRTYVKDSVPIAYTFKNGELITTFNNNPNLQNLRNDFSVWGTRKGISGKDLPVHMRYAIDKKPTIYTTINVSVDDAVTKNTIDKYNNKYGATVGYQESKTYSVDEYDWRELIYQMGRDYYKYAHILDDFDLKVAQANPHYQTGKTGYENYYLDLVSFWRDLYDISISSEEYIKIYPKDKTEPGIIQKLQTDIKANNDTIKTLTAAIDTLKKELQTTPNDEEKTQLLEKKEEEKIKLENEQKSKAKDLNYYLTQQPKYDNYYYDGQYKYWNEAVYEAPQNLNFWFDFLDTDGELSQFSVKNIGCRPKAINDSNVKAIYFREIPPVIFSNNLAEDMQQSASYTFIKINKLYENTMFSISSQGKSAKETVDELLYKHSYCIDSVTINAIPIYYLEPNSRIQIVDDKTNINGYYTISKMSIPLAYNGTMSITATRAADLNI